MDYGDNYGFDEDVAVYSFDSLQDNTDLGGLLDEGLDDFNDETFGALEDAPGPVGRDFDFAGSTSRLLGNDSKQLQSADSSWLSGPAQPQQQSQQRGQAPSPWSTLDADPLLSGGPVRTPLPPLAQPQQQYAPQQQQSQGQQRAMRTLEEIEAEMRAQQLAAQQQQQQQQSQPMPGRPLTLEEVEAEMLKKARSQGLPQQPGQHLPPQQQQQFPPQPQQQQLPFGAFPPGHFPPGHFPPPGQMPFGMPPQGFPPHMQGQFPPLGPGGQPMRPGSVGGLGPQGQQAFPPLGAQGTPPPQGPPGMMQPPPGMSPVPRPQQAPMPGQQLGAPLGAGQQMPHGLPGQQGPPNMMSTLFPPLPSQGGLASVEQQLQYLTMNQHAQHPSLTGAQLQALLQQAQYQVAKEGEKLAEKKEGDATEKDGETEESKKAAAGEQLIRNVEMRIMEHEMMEQKRKRKANKIASMAKHNNLMSNSDKDFITRIQVSQLVTDDPYADDFYFHIMAAIKASRQQASMAAGAPPGMLLPGGQLAGGPMGPGGPQNGGQGGRSGQRKPTRRENAMNKMAQNVQRLVDNAKQRNQKGQLSLDGALGKIALRTRSAPRQLLQVKPGTSSAPSTSAGTALLAGLISQSESASNVTGADSTSQGTPLSHRAACTIIERIYDAVLELEQMRRIQPAVVGAEQALKEQVANVPEGVLDQALAEASQAVEEWNGKYGQLVDTLWKELRVMEPLDSCSPHPFISLVSVLKGKRILPRAIRHLSPEQTLTLFTLIVATFDTLDTVVDAPVLDATDDVNKLSAGSLEGKQRRAVVETKTEVFLNAVVAPLMGVIGQAPLRMVTGMLGLLMERNDLRKVVQSKPGIAFMTIFLSRAESLKQATPAPDAQDLAQWQQTFDHLFSSLVNSLPSLFPSTRAVSSLPFGSSYYLSGQSASNINALRPDVDLDDEPVWRFLAAVAVCADPNEQQSLVTNVRDKVLENVSSANKGRVTPEVAALKIRNVNLLLHSLGLDASQLTVDE